MYAIFFGRATLHLALAWLRDTDARPPSAAGFADDAGHLSTTRVAETWDIPADPAQAEEQLRALLKRAREQHLPVSIAGARHTMGGQTIAPGGIVINMLPLSRLELDEKQLVLRAAAGARWADVIKLLDSKKLSVAVMQSNNNFSVGGSLSANCHGWATGRPPIASTVRSFRLMKADGKVVRCSRTENSELFSATLGGYGLLGIILQADLDVVPNECLRPECFVISAAQYWSTYVAQTAKDSGVNMAYGRLSIAPGETFLKEAILTLFHPVSEQSPPELTPTGYRTLRRTIVRGSVGNDYGKQLRWDWEKSTLGKFCEMRFSRNQLINEGVELYQDNSQASTNILHEYFVPAERLEEFLVEIRRIIPTHGGDLLNVTVRDVRPDKDTLLNYADGDMLGLVMLFSEGTAPAADVKMEQMTQDMIEAALKFGGRYYLPYRLHATPQQFQRAYPRAPAFFELKRRVDPSEAFQNQFYRKYKL